MEKTVKIILEVSPDPLFVRKTTADVFNNLNLIEIDISKIREVAFSIKNKFLTKQVLTQDQFGSDNPTPQLLFLLDSINFCFWSNKDERKWMVEYPKGNVISGGWFSLVYSFQRALHEKIPLLNAGFLKNLDMNKAEYIFRGVEKVRIPLLKDRVKILNQVGNVLEKKFKGKIDGLLEESKYNLDLIIKKTVKYFPSFEDFSIYNEKRINFYKRAQIFAYDLCFLPQFKFKRLNTLTAFADYKVPQILRHLKIVKYSKKLSDLVDNYEILKKGSVEEIEIRSSNIWVCELIAYELKIDPVLVDNILWKMSQGFEFEKPYHRVVTTAY